jgi:uncharacterized protein (DUF3084 family)
MYAQLMRLEEELKKVKLDLRQMGVAKEKADSALAAATSSTSSSGLAPAAAAVTARATPTRTSAKTATSPPKPHESSTDNVSTLRSSLQRAETELKSATRRMTDLTAELTKIRHELTQSRDNERRADDAERRASELALAAKGEVKAAVDQGRVWQQELAQSTTKIGQLEQTIVARDAGLTEANRQLALLRTAIATTPLPSPPPIPTSAVPATASLPVQALASAAAVPPVVDSTMERARALDAREEAVAQRELEWSNRQRAELKELEVKVVVTQLEASLRSQLVTYSRYINHCLAPDTVIFL